MKPACRNRRPSRWGRVVGVLVCWVLIAGCSTRLIYDHLDSVALWYVSSFVSLDEEQESALQESLQRTLAWHRHNELGRYAKFLRELADRTTAPIDAAMLEDAGEQLGNFWKAVLAQVAPDAVKLLTSLRPDQVEEFMGKLEKRERERRDRALARSLPEQVEAREKMLTKQLTRWLGSLDEEQRAIAKRTAASMPPESSAGYESRQAWRMRIREVLAPSDTSDEVRKQELLSLLEHPERSWTEAHRQQNEEEKRRFMDMLLQIDLTLKPEQRQVASRKLLDLAKQLEALQ